MSESEKDNKGCFGTILILVGIFGVLASFDNDAPGWIEYLGVLIPIGYLVYSS
jgi:hypothetical protein